MSFDDFLDFKLFITKSFMKIIYIIGAVLITLGGFAMMVGGSFSSIYGLPLGLSGVLGGLALLTLGHLAWRLICESIIIIFSIHDSLVSIDNKTKPPIQKTVAPPAKKFCNNCGTQISITDRFCSKCGNNLIPKPKTIPKPPEKAKPANI